MSALEFVDTNILLYAVDATELAKHHIASELVGSLWARRCGCLSIQVLQEFYVNATRKISFPLTSQEALEAVSDYSNWLVHAPTSQDVIAAIMLHETHQLSFWDAMIINSASALGATTLYSEDLNSGQTMAEVKIINPFDA